VARRQEKERLRHIERLESGNSLIPEELEEPIPDPEKEVTNEDIERQLWERLITFPEFSGVTIPDSHITAIVDQNIDPTLEFESQQDYISFGDSLTFNID
jgi:hypothetical protein